MLCWAQMSVILKQPVDWIDEICFMCPWTGHILSGMPFLSGSVLISPSLEGFKVTASNIVYILNRFNINKQLGLIIFLWTLNINCDFLENGCR